MTTPRRIAVVGGSGFVGVACLSAARNQDLDVWTVAAPRLSTSATTVAAIQQDVSRHSDIVAELAERVQSADVVVNAAGLAAPGAPDSGQLRGANGLLPAVIHSAIRHAGAARYVHVSSAAVQGAIDALDESWGHAPFSPYSTSKALGESALRATDDPDVVVYRATSVQGVSRETTRRLVALAGARWSSVAGDGAGPSPQVLVQNLADGIVYAATSSVNPPPVVLHPWEGLTCRDVLTLLGGSEPRELPEWLARMLVRGTAALHRPGTARRLEMLWFGQRQTSTWLDDMRWRPRYGRDAWLELASAVRRGSHDDRGSPEVDVG